MQKIKLDVKIVVNKKRKPSLTYTTSAGDHNRIIDDFLERCPNHPMTNGLLRESFADYMVNAGYPSVKSKNVMVDIKRSTVSVTLDFKRGPWINIERVSTAQVYKMVIDFITDESNRQKCFGLISEAFAHKLNKQGYNKVRSAHIIVNNDLSAKAMLV